MTTRSPVRRMLAGFATGVLLVAACGTAPTPTPPPTAAPTPTPAAPTPLSSGAQAAIYASIERDVEGIRQLQPTRAVAPTLLDEAGLRAELAAHASEDQPPAEVARQARLLKALGALRPDADLAGILRSFLEGQVAGFYRPSDGQLYVVSRGGGIGPLERTTFAHEYTHALQDQHFPLLHELGRPATDGANGDRDLARLALIEGDASLVMTLWAQEHLSPLDLLGMLRSSMDPAQQAALAAMPPFLRDQALFPYEAGLQFALGRQTGGGWAAIDDAFATPPQSTEQILHPAAFVAREPPLVVSLAPDLPAKLGPGWTQQPPDTMGELQLRAWLSALGIPAAQAATAADGWGGDRVALLEGPGGSWLVALVTRWDTERDALDFATAADAAIATLPTPGRMATRGDRVVVVLGDSSATMDNLAPIILAGVS
jgi:hypothetical protein